MARTSDLSGSSPESVASDDGILRSIYDDLPLDGQYTRIMSLQPDEHEATLSCEIKTTSLKDAQGIYEALSYTWDDKVLSK
jgi:hypothetical protein